jgi:hypothetical protein
MAPSPSSSTKGSTASSVSSIAATPSVAQPSPAADAGAPVLPHVSPAVSSRDAKLAFLRQVCRTAVRRAGPAGVGVDAVGCTCCPPFDDCPPKPGTLDVQVHGSVGIFQLETMVFGSYSRAEADEAAASFQGCESHAENWGGTVLYARAPGGKSAWKQLQYVSGFHPDSCFAVRGDDGRDRLVCERTDAHQGFGERYLFTHDFEEKEFTADDLLLLLESNDNCNEASMSNVGDRLVRASLRGEVMAIVDGRVALVAHVDFGVATLDKPFARACANAERVRSPALYEKARTLLPPPTAIDIAFVFDGHAFSVAPASAASFKQVTTAFEP